MVENVSKFTDVSDISKLNDFSEYLRIISEYDIMCPLELWKKWQNHLPGLAKIAKKYQGVQDSPAACERMFSTARNIFSLKHRRVSVLLLTTLVFLKLNLEL